MQHNGDLASNGLSTMAACGRFYIITQLFHGRVQYPQVYYVLLTRWNTEVDQKQVVQIKVHAPTLFISIYFQPHLIQI